MIPDLRIGGRPVSLGEIEAAPCLPVDAYVAMPVDAGAASPLARRDKFTEDLIQRGMSPDRAVSQARRTAEWTSRRERG